VFTTHYPAAELSRLLEAANRVCPHDSDRSEPKIVVLRRAAAIREMITPSSVGLARRV